MTTVFLLLLAAYFFGVGAWAKVKSTPRYTPRYTLNVVTGVCELHWRAMRVIAGELSGYRPRKWPTYIPWDGFKPWPVVREQRGFTVKEFIDMDQYDLMRDDPDGKIEIAAYNLSRKLIAEMPIKKFHVQHLPKGVNWSSSTIDNEYGIEIRLVRDYDITENCYKMMLSAEITT